MKESVKNVLTELDARTYASAARKARTRDEHDRAAMFKNAAKDAWNRDYGTSSHDGYGEYQQRTYFDDDYYLGGEDTDDRYIPTHDFQSYSMAGGSADSIKYDPNSPWYDKYADEKIEWGTEFPRHKHVAKFGQGMKVAKQMTNNTGKYVKGKGWQ